jgi:hypothetical protein
MTNVCLALLCWLSLRLFLLSMFLPILAEAVLQDSVLHSGIGLPVRRIWAAVLLLPLLMPFFGGGAADSSSSSSAALSADSFQVRREAASQRQRVHRAAAAPIIASVPPPSLPASSSGSSSAALSADSFQVRREAASQRQRVHRAAAAPIIASVPPPSLPASSSGSSSAALSADSFQVRREAASQRQRVHRLPQQDRQAAAREPAPAIEAAIMGSFQFTEEELAYAADNFERSPVAALAFSVANTGIANTPEDLGPLLDGPPDPGDSILAFKRRTETPLHGCACCGMRTYDCIRLTERVLALHIMTATDVTAFDALSPVMKQVKSTCTILGRRYMLHPELVQASTGDAF